MVIINSYLTAVILLFITMICWGSWANTQKLASKGWSFQLFYWDYTIGVVLMSLLFAITMGSFGTEGRNFLLDISQGTFENFLSAFIGGVVFNIANLLLVAAIDIAGMAVAFPIGIGIALVWGVVVNYLYDPVGNPIILFVGVGLVVIAIVIDAIAYKRLPSQSGTTSTKGILISVVAGIAMGFFYRFVAASMTENFAVPEIGRLTPYTAVFIFSVGIFISNFLWNTIFMYKPLKGSPVSYIDYFSLGTSKLHLIGILGGAIWCIGMSFSILASEQAGFAISYGLGQGATMVAAAWGVYIWKEFKDADPNTKRLIPFMFLSFIVGLGLIIIARIIS
jgi:glucose uptake protein